MSAGQKTFVIAVEVTNKGHNSAKSLVKDIPTTKDHTMIPSPGSASKRAIIIDSESDDASRSRPRPIKRRSLAGGPGGAIASDVKIKAADEATSEFNSHIKSRKSIKSEMDPASLSDASDSDSDSDSESDSAWARHVSSEAESFVEEGTSRSSRSIYQPTATFEGRIDKFAFTQAKKPVVRPNRVAPTDEDVSRLEVAPPNRLSSPSPVWPPERVVPPKTESVAGTANNQPEIVPRLPSPPVRFSQDRENRPDGALPVIPADPHSHLPGLADTVALNLFILFVGVNPGVRSGTLGYPYAHPSNMFWKLLHESGITPRRCLPKEHLNMPDLYRIGNTNVVSRTTQSQANLVKGELEARIGLLEEKVRQSRPEVVCLVGKGVWESVWKAKHGRKIKKEQFRYGFQSEEENLGRIRGDAWNGSRVFVGASTSGLAASLKTHEKLEIYKELGEWVHRRRQGSEL